eukprot:5612879-Amphidinium_carterae.1
MRAGKRSGGGCTRCSTWQGAGDQKSLRSWQLFLYEFWSTRKNETGDHEHQQAQWKAALECLENTMKVMDASMEALNPAWMQLKESAPRSKHRAGWEILLRAICFPVATPIVNPPPGARQVDNETPQVGSIRLVSRTEAEEGQSGASSSGTNPHPDGPDPHSGPP